MVMRLNMLHSFLGLRGPIVCFAPADDNAPGIIELEENLGDVEKPPEIPAGKYPAEVQDVQTPTSGKGNEYFAVKFVIPQEELPPDMQGDFPEGAILYWNRTVVPKGRDRRALHNLRKLVEALGLDSNTTSIDPNEWMGRQALIYIRLKKWEGEDRAEIASVEKLPGSGGTKKPARGNKRVAEAADDDDGGEEEVAPRRAAGRQAARGGASRRR